MRRSERRDAGSNPAPAASLATSVGQRSVRKSSGRMRALSRKQVASWSRLWVRVPRLPLGVAERIEGETGNSGPLPREPLSASASPFTRAYRPTGRCRSCKPEIRVQLPIGPLVRQRFCRNFDSRGPAATTPGLHPGNDGSSPSGSIFTNGTCSASVCQPAEQPGLNPGECGFESRLRHCLLVMTSRRGTQTGQAAKLKPSCSVGSSPTRAISVTTNCPSLWSSPECSPPCHGGGQGFKSPQGRWGSRGRSGACRQGIRIRLAPAPRFDSRVGWALVSPRGRNPRARG